MLHNIWKYTKVNNGNATYAAKCLLPSTSWRSTKGCTPVKCRISVTCVIRHLRFNSLFISIDFITKTTSLIRARPAVVHSRNFPRCTITNGFTQERSHLPVKLVVWQSHRNCFLFCFSLKKELCPVSCWFQFLLTCMFHMKCAKNSYYMCVLPINQTSDKFYCIVLYCIIFTSTNISVFFSC